MRNLSSGNSILGTNKKGRGKSQRTHLNLGDG